MGIVEDNCGIISRTHNRKLHNHVWSSRIPGGFNGFQLRSMVGELSRCSIARVLAMYQWIWVGRMGNGWKWWSKIQEEQVTANWPYNGTPGTPWYTPFFSNQNQMPTALLVEVQIWFERTGLRDEGYLNPPWESLRFQNIPDIPDRWEPWPPLGSRRRGHVLTARDVLKTKLGGSINGGSPK